MDVCLVYLRAQIGFEANGTTYDDIDMTRAVFAL